MLSLLLTSAAVMASAPGDTRALVIGVNRSVDEDLAPLRFADDDALAYATLFEAQGVPALVLTRADDDTRRLFPEAAAEARLPTKEGLLEARAELRTWAAAHPDGTLYVVYAGHGNARGGSGYITLEDARLTGGELRRELIDVIAPARVHLVVDACYSIFLAFGRGPGGERRIASGFSEVDELLGDPRVGLLLSTSVTNQTHEWERFGAGVFSHLVRSGLWGGADADADGGVDYKELAAFVSRATESIDNPRYRPSIFARPPAGSERFLEPQEPAPPRLALKDVPRGRYLVEDGRGVRYADLHAGAAVPWLRLPPTNATLYVRNWETSAEWVVDKQALALVQQAPTSSARGAAHEAFEKLLVLDFDPDVVSQYRFAAFPSLDVAAALDAPLPAWRRAVGWSALGATAVSMGSTVWLTASALGTRDDVPQGASHAAVARANDRIELRNKQALGFSIAGGTAALSGLLFLLLPDPPPPTGLEP